MAELDMEKFGLWLQAAREKMGISVGTVSPPEKFPLTSELFLWCYHGAAVRQDYSYFNRRAFYAEFRLQDDTLINGVSEAWRLYMYLLDDNYYDDDIIQTNYMYRLKIGGYRLVVSDDFGKKIFSIDLTRRAKVALQLALGLAIHGPRSIDVDRAAVDPIYTEVALSLVLPEDSSSGPPPTMETYNVSYHGRLGVILEKLYDEQPLQAKLKDYEEVGADGTKLTWATMHYPGHGFFDGQKANWCCAMGARNSCSKALFLHFDREGMIPENFRTNPPEEHHCIKKLVDYLKEH